MASIRELGEIYALFPERLQSHINERRVALFKELWALLTPEEKASVNSKRSTLPLKRALENRSGNYGVNRSPNTTLRLIVEGQNSPEQTPRSLLLSMLEKREDPLNLEVGGQLIIPSEGVPALESPDFAQSTRRGSGLSLNSFHSNLNNTNNVNNTNSSNSSHSSNNSSPASSTPSSPLKENELLTLSGKLMDLEQNYPIRKNERLKDLLNLSPNSRSREMERFENSYQDLITLTKAQIALLCK